MPQYLLFTIENPDKHMGVPPAYVDIFWNSDTSAIELSHTPANTITVHLGNRVGEISPFYFCVGTTLSQFRLRTLTPFAERVETPNAAACVVISVCDAYILNPLIITNDNGSGNGSVSVRGYTSKPFIEDAGVIKTTAYRLNSGSWQPSPVFYNLPAGTYTAYMKDAADCIATKEFTIESEPVYAVRFFLTYKDSFDVTTRIDILKKGYDGLPEEVRAAGEPLVIKERAEGFFTTIRGQEAIISLLEFTEDQYIELFTGDDREFKVEVYKSTALKWVGFVLPDLYQAPYLAPPNAFSFSASDALGDLKEIPFTDGIPEGILSQWEVLLHILKKTGTNLGMNSGINLYETRMGKSESEEPMQQAFVSLDAYVEDDKVWDCGRVLDALLQSYGAFIRQCNGAWELVRTEDLKSNYIRRYYTAQGEYLSYELIYPNKLITGPHNGLFADRLYWINRSQYLELRPAYKQSEVTIDYNKRENLIPGGDINAEDFTRKPDVLGIPQGYTHRHFEGNPRFELVYPDPDKADEPALGIPAWIESGIGLPPTNSPATTTFFDSERVFVYKEPTVAYPFYSSLRIRIEYRITGTKTASTNPSFIFSARLNDYYLHTEDFFQFSPRWQPGYAQVETEVTSLNSWQTYEVSTFDIPEDGWFSFRLHSADIKGDLGITGIQFRKISVMPVVGAVPPLAKNETFITKSPRINHFTPEPVKATHGDVIPLRNARLMYRNLIMVNGALQPSLDWQRRGKTEATPILKLLADSMLSLNETPVKLLRGTLKGTFEWNQVIQEATVLTRYMPVGFEYNDRENTISSDFMELLGTTQPVATKRILEETGEPLLMENGTYIAMEQ